MTENNEMPLLLYPFPSAVIHVDANAFFTSVEQALNPRLKGMPVVTGKERGIIACASYEAKALGIKRGLSLHDAKRMCPRLIVLPSDYETYSLFSKRMFNIIRRYTPVVEESSVDEAFADISGMRRVFHMSYDKIAERIRHDVKNDLDITVSAGLSVSKSLAKLASGFKKPDGLTVVPGTGIHLFLKGIAIARVWGIGPNSANLLGKYGVATAYDFVSRPENWVSGLLGKPGREIWNELRGNPVYPVSAAELAAPVSVSKTKTFSTPSGDRHFVYARLVRNVESAFIKLRRHRLMAQVVGVMLRRGNYEEEGLEARLSRPTASTQEVMPMVKALFDHVFKDGVEYRSAMVFLSRLAEDTSAQLDLFEDRLKIERMENASKAIDAINKKYGKHSVSLGSTLFLANAPRTEKDVPPVRKTRLLVGETPRRRLNIPMIMARV